MLTRLDLRDGDLTTIDTLASPLSEVSEEHRQSVRHIISYVRELGDVALRELAQRFDNAVLEEIAVPKAVMADARRSLATDVEEALSHAARRIHDFHTYQLQAPSTYSSQGVTVQARSVPVERAGLYVPGGKAAYPSTVLMTAIPARVAGVEHISICVPPTADGEISAITLAAAEIAGVDELYRLGGAGAIAAMAYGTESVSPCDVIAGPGNIYVALAQQEVSGVVGIAAGFAGPSEVAVIADSATSPEFAARDILTQAEHGPSGRAWLISDSEKLLAETENVLSKLLENSPRRTEAEATLREGGFSALVGSLEAAVQVSDRLGPEHLQIMCEDAQALSQKVKNAGAVFCGPLATAAIGDYVAGPSHVLPTSGTAKFANGIQVADFQKRLQIISVHPEGYADLARTAVTLAEAEGLYGHRDAVLARLEGLQTPNTDADRQPTKAIAQLRPNIVALEKYHSPQLDVNVRLNTNESPLPPPAGFTDAVSDALNKIAWNRYPERNAQSLCRSLGELHNLPQEMIFAANGSNEVLQTLLMCYGGAGRKVAVFQPTYALHTHISQSLVSEVVIGKRDSEFRLDIDSAIDLIQRERPSVVFLCSPNNPTGIAESNQTVATVLKATSDVGGLLVVDEAYVEFSPESAEELLGDATPMVITRTYSKTWAMAAARLGYLMGPPSLVADLEKAALPYRLSAMTLAVGEIALQFQDEMSERIANIISERSKIIATLNDLQIPHYPSDANFVLFRPELPRSYLSDQQGNPKLAGIPEGDPVWRMLVSHSVLVRDCSSWPGLAGCLRVTVGKPEENASFLSALSAILNDI